MTVKRYRPNPDGPLPIPLEPEDLFEWHTVIVDKMETSLKAWGEGDDEASIDLLAEVAQACTNALKHLRPDLFACPACGSTQPDQSPDPAEPGPAPR